MNLAEKREELVNKAASRIGHVKEKYAGVAADITAEIVQALSERVNTGYGEIAIFVDYADSTNGHAFWNWLFGREDEISVADMKLIWEVVRNNLKNAGFGLGYTGTSMKRTEYWRGYDWRFEVSIGRVKPNPKTPK